MDPVLKPSIARYTLKTDLMAREEATALFGNEREDNLAAVLGNQ